MPVALGAVAGVAGGGLVSSGCGMERGSESSNVRWFAGRTSAIDVGEW